MDNKEETITLQVFTSGAEEVHFKIKKDSTFKRLMEKYCERMGFDSTEAVNFIYEGSKIISSNTPHRLGMASGDRIEVVVAQVGG